MHMACVTSKATASSTCCKSLNKLKPEMVDIAEQHSSSHYQLAASKHCQSTSADDTPFAEARTPAFLLIMLLHSSTLPLLLLPAAVPACRAQVVSCNEAWMRTQLQAGLLFHSCQIRLLTNRPWLSSDICCIRHR
jgi:hypothetical protein